ncbi:hypothetical protein HK098_002616 [Nowakowskiella sp. JEL0407]|nr:hypothetical protein HK098_002616 [Nowakowskiella sp. JEL0407]
MILENAKTRSNMQIEGIIGDLSLEDLMYRVATEMKNNEYILLHVALSYITDLFKFQYKIPRYLFATRSLVRVFLELKNTAANGVFRANQNGEVLVELEGFVQWSKGEELRSFTKVQFESKIQSEKPDVIKKWKSDINSSRYFESSLTLSGSKKERTKVDIAVKLVDREGMIWNPRKFVTVSVIATI